MGIEERRDLGLLLFHFSSKSLPLMGLEQLQPKPANHGLKTHLQCHLQIRPAKRTRLQPQLYPVCIFFVGPVCQSRIHLPPLVALALPLPDPEELARPARLLLRVSPFVGRRGEEEAVEASRGGRRRAAAAACASAYRAGGGAERCMMRGRGRPGGRPGAGGQEEGQARAAQRSEGDAAWRGMDSGRGHSCSAVESGERREKRKEKRINKNDGTHVLEGLVGLQE